MMRFVIVAIYDRAVGAYSRPAFLRSEGEAIRVFSDEVNKPPSDVSPMGSHPEHFSLWFMGHWFDDSGLFHAPEGGNPTELVSAERVLVQSRAPMV